MEAEKGKDSPDQKDQVRNRVAFWLLGLCSNFGFNVMLCASYDILHKDSRTVPEMVVVSADVASNLTNSTGTGRFDCHTMSTGAVLLADVIPETLINLSAPWFADYIPYAVRTSLCVLTAAGSFLLVPLVQVHVVFFSFVGVVLTSASAGIGSSTFLSLMSYYEKNVVSAWSSGTGASGLIGSLVYAGLTGLLGPRDTLLIMLTVPAVMLMSYWCVLVKSPIARRRQKEQSTDEEKNQLVDNNPQEGADKEDKDFIERHPTLKERFWHLKYLMKYITPLFLVYVAQYFINQGLLELIYFRGISMSHDSQYRWYQVIYRLGSFLSRSSVNVVKFERLWVFAVLQWCVLMLVFTEVFLAYMPSIAIAFAVTLLEGLVGGAAYVNTFYQIRQHETPKFKEFSMAVTQLATTSGSLLAGVLAIPVHDSLCRL